jgi:hypothetical protein
MELNYELNIINNKYIGSAANLALRFKPQTMLNIAKSNLRLQRAKVWS